MNLRTIVESELTRLGRDRVAAPDGHPLHPEFSWGKRAFAKWFRRQMKHDVLRYIVIPRGDRS
jgi:hypothetical protein